MFPAGEFKITFVIDVFSDDDLNRRFYFTLNQVE